MARPKTSRRAETTLVRSLFHAHGRAMLAYATRLTGDSATAEDVVERALLRVAREGHDDQGSVRGKLLMVIRAIVRGSEPAAGIPGLEMLERLDPEHREVLVQVYFKGRTAEEAAAELGASVGAVKSRSYHALRALCALRVPGELFPGRRAGMGGIA